MKTLIVKPTKNSLKEIKNWVGDGGEVLSLITEYRDGVFEVQFPESDEEEREMVDKIHADSDGKKYPNLITQNSENIDLSDYAHEMIRLGVSSTRWEIQKAGKDISAQHRTLLDQLEGMSDEEFEEYLEDNSWEMDFQYFFIGSVASAST